MVTLKEYEIYLKVKRFIDTEGCDEVEIISRLINRSNYVPLIISSDDKEPIKYYYLSAAAKGCGVSKQTLDYAYRNRCTRIVRRKEVLRNLELIGKINFTPGEIDLFQNLGFAICSKIWDSRFVP